MDKKSNCKIPQCGMVPDLTAEKVVVGAKQLRKAVLSGRAKRVFLAQDADPAVTEPIAELCGQYNIHVTPISTMSRLGQACGIEVGAAAAAVVDI